MIEHHELPPIRSLPWPPNDGLRTWPTGPDRPGLDEPELGPDDFHDDVDWSTFSHRRLYEMATDGLDLDGANAVAERWSMLGSELDDIGARLRKTLELSADAWRGPAAEDTRDVLRRLVEWTRDTADISTEVSECVSEQATLAAGAAREMPVPPRFIAYPAVEPDPVLRTPRAVPAVEPDPVPIPSEAPFLGSDLLIEDPARREGDRAAAHQRAVEVMRSYQDQSRAVYARVPAFRDPDPDAVGVKDVPIEDEPDDRTTTSGVVPGPAPILGGGAAGPSGAPNPGGGSSTGNTTGAAPPPAPGANSAVLGGGGAPAASGPAASAGPPGGRGAMGMGAMPMGAAGARPQQDDNEHRRPAYLEEETDDIWGGGGTAVAPVIGESPGGRG